MLIKNCPLKESHLRNHIFSKTLNISLSHCSTKSNVESHVSDCKAVTIQYADQQEKEVRAANQLEEEKSRNC